MGRSEAGLGTANRRRKAGQLLKSGRGNQQSGWRIVGQRKSGHLIGGRESYQLMRTEDWLEVHQSS